MASRHAKTHIAGLTCTYGKMSPNMSVGQLCPLHENPGLAGVFVVSGAMSIPPNLIP
ncbi:Uncharacterised protein [Mycobacteroides abscessus subsp. abscessus]|nr:Uncharacterised protein [Mycobacteroides abscessus subsp. abscessus]